MAWRDRLEPEPPAPLLAPQPRATVTVEQMLLNRLGWVREVLAEEAAANGWNPDAVDRILAAGSLEPITREFVVQFEETVNREVRVRAVSKEAASAQANNNGGRLVGVREVADGG